MSLWSRTFSIVRQPSSVWGRRSRPGPFSDVDVTREPPLCLRKTVILSRGRIRRIFFDYCLLGLRVRGGCVRERHDNFFYHGTVPMVRAVVETEDVGEVKEDFLFRVGVRGEGVRGEGSERSDDTRRTEALEDRRHGTNHYGRWMESWTGSDG